MSIFPSNPEVGDEFSGKRWNGTTWEVIGVNLSRDYALESSFTSHTSASTSVHGIPNTSVLATQANVASASAAAASYADTAISNLVDYAPEALNTLNELAAALGDDSNFATTVTNSLSTKASASTVNNHISASTNVHGIVDMGTLVSGSGITNIVALTQEQYDALTPPDSTTLYVVTD